MHKYKYGFKQVKSILDKRNRERKYKHSDTMRFGFPAYILTLKVSLEDSDNLLHNLLGGGGL